MKHLPICSEQAILDALGSVDETVRKQRAEILRANDRGEENKDMGQVTLGESQELTNNLATQLWMTKVKTREEERAVSTPDRGKGGGKSGLGSVNNPRDTGRKRGRSPSKSPRRSTKSGVTQWKTANEDKEGNKVCHFFNTGKCKFADKYENKHACDILLKGKNHACGAKSHKRSEHRDDNKVPA